ncbi:hypothetical protein [Frankia sp. R82]|uniref:hypothetical protein n=1 Tax=Frankia sp. R82 TaxID=2950553 RepID=UPI002043488B|nr:hypothetical protein [Frankia sp. R82]MCM3884139.1 hypothetical protein [Frankia sp. R82]
MSALPDQTSASTTSRQTVVHVDLPHAFEQLANRATGLCGLCGSTVRGGMCHG